MMDSRKYTVSNWIHDRKLLSRIDVFESVCIGIGVLGGVSLFFLLLLAAPVVFHSVFDFTAGWGNALLSAGVVGMNFVVSFMPFVIMSVIENLHAGRIRRSLISKVLQDLGRDGNLVLSLKTMASHLLPSWLEGTYQSCLIDRYAHLLDSCPDDDMESDGSIFPSDGDITPFFKLLAFLRLLPEDSPSDELRETVLREMDSLLEQCKVISRAKDTSKQANETVREALDTVRMGDDNQKATSEILTMRARLDDIIVDSQSDSHKHEKPVVMGMAKTI